MPIHSGTAIRLEYTLKVDGKVIETTSEERAKAEGIFRENRPYRPLVCFLGRGQIIPGLERHLMEKAVPGTPGTLTVAPQDAYGERTRENTRALSLKAFGGEQVAVGSQVQVDGRRGTIVKVGGGRCTVDFNHELAGKTLDYEFNVLQVLEKPEEKVEAFLEMGFGPGKSTFILDDGLDGEPGLLEVRLPTSVNFNQNFFPEKMRLLQGLRNIVPPEHDIRLVEVYPGAKPPVIPADVPRDGVETDAERASEQAALAAKAGEPPA